MNHSAGEVTIEGWDQPSIELTTVKSTYGAADELDRVRISLVRRGDDVSIITAPQQHRGVALQYRMRVPRAARVIIEHNSGEINISDVAGPISATSTQGVIMLHVRKDAAYAIEAKTTLGSVISDFPGMAGRRWFFGHSLRETAPAPAQQLFLRGRYGDILILKKLVPER